MRNLYDEYLAGAADLSEFYARPISSLSESPKAIRWDPQLREELKERNEALGNPVSIPEEATPVVTGQQPALFTGPLYTIYKAVTAVKLARRLEERTGVPHVPVFWIGSDDHDLEEARSAHFLSKNHEPFTLRYDPDPPVEGRPMFNVPVQESLHTFVDTAASETPGSEFRDPLVAFLHESLRASQSLAEWASRLLAYLFRETPLILFAPHWPHARRLAAPVFEREILEPLGSTSLLNEAGARLQALGFPQQVAKAPNECNFFLFVDGLRRKVVYREGQFHLPEIGQRYSQPEMLDLLRESPDRFSANVALRCLVQQHILGPAAYIGGPSELAYWAQLKPLFDHFELPMPVVYPRSQCVLTTIKLNKLMEKFELRIPDLYAPVETLVEKALRRTSHNSTLQALEDHRPRVQEGVQALAQALSSNDANLRSMAESFAERVRDDLDRLERAILLGDRAQVEAVEKQVRRLVNALAPWRKPQERVYTVFSFLFQQGPALIGRLLDELDPESFQLREVEL